MLEAVQMWEVPRSVEDVVARLTFIENKDHWHASVQGGVRQISEADYHTIGEHRVVPPGAPGSEDTIVSKSQFVLEAHLEEFIDKNWQHIDVGAKLAKYEVDEQAADSFRLVRGALTSCVLTTHMAILSSLNANEVKPAMPPSGKFCALWAGSRKI